MSSSPQKAPGPTVAELEATSLELEGRAIAAETRADQLERMLRKTSAELERTVKASSKAEDTLNTRVTELEKQIMTIMTQTLMGDDDELDVVTVDEVRETTFDPTYSSPSASVQRMAASFKASHLAQIETLGYTFAENGVPFVAYGNAS